MSKESTKDEAILLFKEKATKISSIESIYCKPTQEGVDFLILVNPERLPETLKEIVALEIELEKTYENIYFDFYYEPSSESRAETSGWSPLYIKV
jgi:hypothetical protein